MSEYIIQKMPIDIDDELCWMVKQISTGWFYPYLSKTMAVTLCDKLNEPFNKSEDRFFIEDEYVKDKEHEMESIWIERYSDALKLKDFLNDNICKK